MIRVTLNGKPRHLDASKSIAALLKTLKVSPEQVAVALNGEVVTRDTWFEVWVGDGDNIEVVRAVGGG